MERTFLFGYFTSQKFLKCRIFKIKEMFDKRFGNLPLLVVINILNGVVNISIYSDRVISFKICNDRIKKSGLCRWLNNSSTIILAWKLFPLSLFENKSICFKKLEYLQKVVCRELFLEFFQKYHRCSCNVTILTFIWNFFATAGLYVCMEDLRKILKQFRILKFEGDMDVL